MDVFKLEDSACAALPSVTSSTASPPDHLNGKLTSDSLGYSNDSYGISFYETNIKKEFDDGKQICIYDQTTLPGELAYSTKNHDFGVLPPYTGTDSQPTTLLNPLSRNGGVALNVSGNGNGSPPALATSPPLVTSNGPLGSGSRSSAVTLMYEQKRELPESSSSPSLTHKNKPSNGRKNGTSNSVQGMSRSKQLDTKHAKQGESSFPVYLCKK